MRKIAVALLLGLLAYWPAVAMAEDASIEELAVGMADTRKITRRSRSTSARRLLLHASEGPYTKVWRSASANTPSSCRRGR